MLLSSSSRVIRALAGALVAVTACASVPPPGPVAAPTQARSEAPTRAAVSAMPTILLAAQLMPPGPAEVDYVLPVGGVVHLLFSRPIDPLTLTPQQFVLALADGRRVAPVGSFLAPGTGPEGQRSVALLIAARPVTAVTSATTPPDPTPADPLSVTITGLLHDAQGRVLEGLASDIRPASAPVFAVRAEPGPPGACAGGGQALRVFWSAPVRRAMEPATALLLVGMDGRRAPAEVAEGSARPVLELCASGMVGVRAVEVVAGAMVDERGSPTATGTLTVSPEP